MTSTTETEELEGLLSQLLTTEAKANTMTIYYSKRINWPEVNREFRRLRTLDSEVNMLEAVVELYKQTIPEEYLKTILWESDLDHVHFVARIAEKLGLTELAIENYIRAEKYVAAAHVKQSDEETLKKVFERIVISHNTSRFSYYRDIDRVFKFVEHTRKGINSVIELCEKTGQFEYQAALLAERVGMTEQAKELYFTALEKDERAAEEAFEHYEKGEGGHFMEMAIGAAEKLDLKTKRIELCEKNRFWSFTHRYAKAAEYAEQYGMTERALEAYEKGGLFGDAIRLAEKAGLTERVELYQNIQNILEKK